MRSIIYIPAVHLIGVDVQPSYFKARAGDDPTKLSELKNKIEVTNANVAEYWKKVKTYLDQERINPKGVRVYSEAIYAPQEELIPSISRRAEQGSPHMQLFLYLLERGAKYQVTEDKEAHFKHARIEQLKPRVLRFANRSLSGWGSSKVLGQRLKLLSNLEGLSKKQVEERDKGIARNINQTLRDGEIGILIIGGVHRVSRFLDTDIEFRPLHRDLVELTQGDSGVREVTSGVEGEGLGGTEIKG